MVIVLSGTNDFLRRQTLTGLVNDFIAQFGDLGVERIDAGDVEFGRLLESVSSLPFLAEKRMLLVSDISNNKYAGDKIDELLESVSDSTDVIFDEPKFDRRSKLYKTLKSKTDFREFNELDEQGLANWLVDDAKQRGGSLTRSDAVFLVKRAGPNQMGLSQELDKLLSFDVNISRKTIEELVEPMPSSTVFELIDAAFSGNHKKALELYQDQRKQQVEPQAIMGMIAWQVHAIAVVKFNDNKDPGSIASGAKLNPFVVRKTLGLIGKKSNKDIAELVSRTLELDVRLKSEPIDADEAIQHFLLTI